MNSYMTEIEHRLRATSREGVDQLIAWLRSTDFYQAPASTRWHGAHEGGLAEHSLAVHDQLIGLNDHFGFELGNDSMAISALMHDVCKIGCYKHDTRNVKDERGVWHKVPCFKYEEDYPFGGHGSKSVYLVQHFIALSPEEAAAINSHMGQFDATSYSNPSAVYQVNPLAWALHVADEAATHIDKK